MPYHSKVHLAPVSLTCKVCFSADGDAAFFLLFAPIIRHTIYTLVLTGFPSFPFSRSLYPVSLNQMISASQATASLLTTACTRLTHRQITPLHRRTFPAFFFLARFAQFFEAKVLILSAKPVARALPPIAKYRLCPSTLQANHAFASPGFSSHAF